MAKLEIIGKIKEVGSKVAIPTRSGQSYEKRELVLDCSTYDQFSGERYENYVSVEFGGKNVDIEIPPVNDIS